MKTASKNKHAKFYVLLKQMGIPTEDKRDFIVDYTDGVADNLNELHERYPAFYREMLMHMESCVKQISANTTHGEMDKMRKRVIAAIGGYYKQIGKQADIDYIKATACRATDCSNFNKIPKERLRNIYNAFRNQQEDFKAVKQINIEQIQSMTLLN